MEGSMEEKAAEIQKQKKEEETVSADVLASSP